MFKTGKKKAQGATRNTSRQTASTPSRLSALQGWLMLGLGMGLGLFIAFMLYLWKPWQPVQRPAQQPVAANAESQPKPASGPRFDFYRLLPSQKIVPEQPADVTQRTTQPATAVPSPATTAATASKEKPVVGNEAAKPVSKPEPVKTKEPPAPIKEKEDTSKYTLQAGSFKSQAEADRRRARILMLGMSAKIQEVKVKEGQVWYRVIVGPVKGKSGADQAQGSLRGGGIDSLMVKATDSPKK